MKELKSHMFATGNKGKQVISTDEYSTATPSIPRVFLGYAQVGCSTHEQSIRVLPTSHVTDLTVNDQIKTIYDLNREWTVITATPGPSAATGIVKQGVWSTVSVGSMFSYAIVYNFHPSNPTTVEVYRSSNGNFSPANPQQTNVFIDSNDFQYWKITTLPDNDIVYGITNYDGELFKDGSIKFPVFETESSSRLSVLTVTDPFLLFTQ